MQGWPVLSARVGQPKSAGHPAGTAPLVQQSQELQWDGWLSAAYLPTAVRSTRQVPMVPVYHCTSVQVRYSGTTCEKPATGSFSLRIYQHRLVPPIAGHPTSLASPATAYLYGATCPRWEKRWLSGLRHLPSLPRLLVGLRGGFSSAAGREGLRDQHRGAPRPLRSLAVAALAVAACD